MARNFIKARFGTSLAALTALALTGAQPASAQRDPAYAAAREAGQVGERVDGYVGAASPALRAVVEDINIKRKAVYAQRAQANNATLEEYALTIGCGLISQTKPGEKYQAPDGSWQTRTGAAPQRDSRCP